MGHMLRPNNSLERTLTGEAAWPFPSQCWNCPVQGQAASAVLSAQLKRWAAPQNQERLMLRLLAPLLALPVLVVAQTKQQTDSEVFARAFANYCSLSLTSPETKDKLVSNTRRVKERFVQLPDGVAKLCSCVGEELAARIGPDRLATRVMEAKEQGIDNFTSFMLGLPVFQLLEPSENHCEAAYFDVSRKE